MCEFPSNFLFTNIECVSPSKPIPLECNGKLKTTLWTIFANVFRFGKQEVTHKNKYMSMGLVHVLLPN